MSVIPLQCDPGAEAVMTAALRRMTPAQRLAQVDSLWESLRTMIQSQLRSAHPDWTEAKLASEIARRMSHDAGADHALRDGRS